VNDPVRVAFQRELDDWQAARLSLGAHPDQPRKRLQRLLRAVVRLMNGVDRSQALESACQVDFRESCDMSGSYAEFLWSTMAIEASNTAARIKDPDLRLRVLLIGARYMVLAKRTRIAAQDDSDAMKRDSS